LKREKRAKGLAEGLAKELVEEASRLLIECLKQMDEVEIRCRVSRALKSISERREDLAWCCNDFMVSYLTELLLGLKQSEALAVRARGAIARSEPT